MDENIIVNPDPGILLLSLLSLLNQRENAQRKKDGIFLNTSSFGHIYFSQSWSVYHNPHSVLSVSVLSTLEVKMDRMRILLLPTAVVKARHQHSKAGTVAADVAHGSQ